jgi:hypothetical protein
VDERPGDYVVDGEGVDGEGVDGEGVDGEGDAEARVRDVLGTFRAELRDRPSDEDLINTRHIDSLTFVSVLHSLIERSGRDVDVESVGSARLRTIRGMARVFFGPPDGDPSVQPLEGDPSVRVTS